MTNAHYYMRLHAAAQRADTTHQAIQRKMNELDTSDPFMAAYAIIGEAMEPTDGDGFGPAGGPRWRTGLFMVDVPPTCVAMDCCGFTFSAEHTDKDGGYTCPLCAPTADREGLERLAEEFDACAEGRIRQRNMARELGDHEMEMIQSEAAATYRHCASLARGTMTLHVFSAQETAGGHGG